MRWLALAPLVLALPAMASDTPSIGLSVGTGPVPLDDITLGRRLA